MKIEINEAEHATILAALRYWQSSAGMYSAGEQFHFIATNGNEIDALDEDEVGALAERINTEWEG